jgi:uncharacterized membrane protein YhaH (DUF805 family)
MAQTCPRCGLLSPPNATGCDCGYDLVARPALTASSEMGLRALLFSLDGRIGRASYWKFALPYVAIYVTLVYFEYSSGIFDATARVGPFSAIFLLLTAYPAIAVGIKRCHDRDKSGWFLLVGAIPLLNLWPMLELGFAVGTPRPNEYGVPERWPRS